MSISGQLADILASKEAIRQAIERNGIDVGTNVPFSQYAAKIDLFSCDTRLFTAATCAALGGVNPTGGTYTAVDPWDASSTCRYTAPDKSITGCTNVITNTVSYTGSSWPASTYTITAANPGYYIQNNNANNATCTICPVGSYCTGGTAAAVACPAGQSTDGTGATQVSDCKLSIPPIATDYPQIYTWNGGEHGLANSYNGSSVYWYGRTDYDTNLTTHNIYPTYWIQSMCSTQTGNYAAVGNPQPTHASPGEVCWCRLKRRTDNTNGAWVFYSSNSASNCAYDCASRCAGSASNMSGFRSALLSSF